MSANRSRDQKVRELFHMVKMQAIVQELIIHVLLLLLFIAINPFPQNNSVYNSIIRYRNVYWNIVAFVTCMYTVGVVSGLTSTIYLSPTWEYFI